jgi:hypothetical protein
VQHYANDDIKKSCGMETSKRIKNTSNSITEAKEIWKDKNDKIKRVKGVYYENLDNLGDFKMNLENVIDYFDEMELECAFPKSSII